MSGVVERLPTLVIVLFALSASGCAAFVAGGAAATGLAVHDRRSFGTVVDDRAIAVRATDAIWKGEEFDSGDRVKISAYNGWVLLTGEVGSEDKIGEAEERVADLSGVRRVINELEVTDKATMGQRTRDSWTSSRVRTALFGIRDVEGFDPSRVRITTVRETVYLQGLVTQEEAEAVVEEARTVGGVGRVVTVFEYLEDQPPAERG